MKTKRAKRIALLFGGMAAIPFTGLAFNSGSDGSYGIINFTNISTTPLTNTLTLPVDGIFRCGSINIGTNCYVNFVPNALNTPVYLLAQSNIVVAGIIDVSGQPGLTNGSLSTVPGPGGFAGGAGGTPSAGIPIGGGQGPGGGYYANNVGSEGGTFGSGGYGNTNIYGNLLLVPLIGGSGGGGCLDYGSPNLGASGGAGGGALLLASSTSVAVNGSILARGGGNVYFNNIGGSFSGGGSGGGVRIVGPAVTVTGSIDVSGGTNTASRYSYGGNGRVRIDTTSTVNANVIGNGYAASPVVSYGRSLFVLPSVTPQLYFLTAAGTSIPVGTTNAVSVSLPSGSPASQMVTLFATNFLGTVPVQIVATPVTGAPFTTNVILNFPNTNSFVETNVTINVPTGVPTQLNAFANYYVQP